MGLVFDVAIAALILMVLASLGMLAWTVGVSAVAAAERARERVAGMRRWVVNAEAHIADGRGR